MNPIRKKGLLIMLVFGLAFGLNWHISINYPNETSGFCLTFLACILGFAFFMGLVQFITGDENRDDNLS